MSGHASQDVPGGSNGWAMGMPSMARLAKTDMSYRT